MDSLLNLIFMCVFIGGVLLLLLSSSGLVGGSVQSVLREAKQTQMVLRSFLKPDSDGSRPRAKYLFNEESVHSMAHKFVGRFDSAVLSWDEGSVLDLMIERKFPKNYLPDKAWPEDMFQAGLYSLALLEMGVSCRKTRLVIIYCRQEDAKRCLEKEGTSDCLRCKKGRAFTKRFKPREVLKHLARLDEIWYNNRRPIPSPDRWKCRACPFGRNGRCNYSMA
jgi:hypothetical protein